MQTEFDAIVVGAGPAGSSAAILLSRAGWSVALIEKQRFPRRKVCGECIAASNLPLLEALGIGSAFDAIAGPELRRVALMRGNHSIEADLPAATHERYPWGRALGRETLDSLLLDRARRAGAEVIQPWSVQRLEGAPGDWRCQIRSMESRATSNLRARVAIDAHGSWEALPSARGHRLRTDSAKDLLAFKANFRGTSLDDGLLPILSFDGGYGGMVVADGGVTTVACCIRRDRLGACRSAFPGLRAGEAIEQLLRRECRGVRVALQKANRDGPWLAAGPLHPGVRVDAEDGPFRIGNAAGEAHPIIGEGMSMAMQSAWLLCTRLLGAGRTGSSSAAAVQRDVGRRYAEAWRRDFGPRLQLAAAFAHTAMHPASAASLVVMARAWPGLLTLGARLAGKARSVADPASIASCQTPKETYLENLT
jgi:flavin-dependent dehydrogenase